MTVNIQSLSDLPNVYTQQYTKEVSDSIQRINTGLKINDTADDSAAAIIATSLRANASSLGQGFQNASNGYGLVEISNRSLNFQEEILNNIKTQLQVAQTTQPSSRQSIQENIQRLLEDFDSIASNTTYNDLYTLQASRNDTNASNQASITFTSTSSVITPSIQSNTEGLNLTSLKNLSSDALTVDEISTQLDVVDSALLSLDSYKNAFALTKEELGINVDNLKNIQEGNTRSELYLTQANITEETIVFDKYKLLVENSSFALAQANTTQEAVLELLTTIPDYEPRSENETTQKDDKNSFEYDFKTSTTFNSTNEPSTVSAPSLNTTTSTN